MEEIYEPHEDGRFQLESDKSLIYDTKTNNDICMYFNEENKKLLLILLNKYYENI